MRRARGPLLLIAGLLLGACSDPLPPDASGEVIYLETCASCHGDDLSGGGGLTSPRGPALGPGSPAAERPDSFYVQAITRGTGRMPAVRRLTDEQITRVIAYIRHVQETG